MSADEIWIIGTDPPCPRCDYLNQMVVDIVNDLSLSVPVRHVGYTSDEARQLAKEEGLVPGTAKDVAKKLRVAMDWPAILRMIDTAGLTDSNSGQSQCCPSPAAKWTPELDDALRPCEVRAHEAGIMMTPVLVINGKSVHQGCVPQADQTRNWIKATYAHTCQRKALPIDIGIEVLGPGCKKCDTLYDNVLIAIAALSDTERCSVKKRTDINSFRKMGIAVTPGLIINGQIVSAGRVLNPDQIMAYIKINTKKLER